MKFSAIIVLSALLAVEVFAGSEAPTITLIKSFVIKQSLTGNKSDKIFTVQDQQRNRRGIFRRPPSSKYKVAWMPIDLVYVAPGALEPGGKTKYDLALEPKLGNMKYQPETLSFSGRADSLVFSDNLGWGTENTNGDFVPYLIKSDYEEVDEPSYEFFWKGDMGIPDDGDSIYLNYMIKVPKESQIKWGSELGMTRHTFANRFSSNAPPVKADEIFRWQRGNLTTFNQNLSEAPKLVHEFKLPPGIKLTGFALTDDTLYTAEDSGSVSAWNSKGEKLWTQTGKAPLISVKDYLITVSDNYRKLLILNRKDGSKIQEIDLPKYLPRSENSFATVSTDKGVILYFQIPDQSRILCYLITLKN
jgi:hypothetical protein